MCCWVSWASCVFFHIHICPIYNPFGIKMVCTYIIKTISNCVRNDSAPAVNLWLRKGVLTVSGRRVHLGLNCEKQRCEVGRIGKFFLIACVCAFEHVKGHHSVLLFFWGFSKASGITNSNRWIDCRITAALIQEMLCSHHQGWRWDMSHNIYI